MRKLAIILPTFNESKTIEILIKGISEVMRNNNIWDAHIIVVDSNSEDETQQIVTRLTRKIPKLHLLRVEKEGLGKAYIHGFTFALEKLNPYLVLQMDSDLSHDPKKIPEFLQKITEGSDFVIGSRYVKGGSIPKDWGLHRKIFSIVANHFIKFGFMKLKITDWTSGFRAFKAWVIKNAIPYVKDYSGYVFQVALLDFAIKNKAHISTVPIKFQDRIHGKSKINSLQYIIQTFIYVLTKSPFIKFIIVGLIGFVIDFGLSYLFIEKLKRPIWLGTLVSTEAAILSNFLMNNFWSFAHKSLEHKLSSYLPSFLKFNLVSSGSVLIQTLGMQLAATLFGRNMWYLYKVVIILFVIIPYSYILYNKLIWKER